MTNSNTYVATPPGVTVKEQLQIRGMSQKEFAKRMNMSEKHISKFLNGEIILTKDMAIRLEMVLGLPAKFWNNLEAIYREKLELVRVENEMEEDKELLKNYPYLKMAKLGWLETTNNPTKKVFELRKFFEVVKLSLVKSPLIPEVAYKHQSMKNESNYPLIAWVQKAKFEARNIETEAINIKKLKEIVPKLRNMSKSNFETFCPKIASLLSGCGIALVLLPCLDDAIKGATFRDGNKIVIGLTRYEEDAERFWFHLFHEIGHVLLGHINNANGTTNLDEDAANTFSEDVLIPKEKYNSFIVSKYFSKESIKRFSDDVGICPVITAGRLKNDGYIKHNPFC